MASPGSSTSSSTNNNPFAGPDPVLIRDPDIHPRVPVCLDYSTSTYYAWKTYFSLVFRKYHLHDHVDSSVDSSLMLGDDEWTTIDATLIRWFYLTISRDLFHTVVTDGDDTLAVWTKLNGLFTDNQLQRRVFLQQEFFGSHQLDSSIDGYCMRLKKLADELRDLGETISDDLLLSTLTAGINEEFGNAASNLTLIPEPTFPKVKAYLRPEERRMKMAKTRATHTALIAGTSRGGPPPPSPQAPAAPRFPPPAVSYGQYLPPTVFFQGPPPQPASSDRRCGG
ncbi:uncharacterized protein [Aegilops tauschii subsp. strangulata]|uniref:uncharacterized protein n=1 Tax=Aegilops tauschii subsp. strangulata TaxID=200361 RepID=UPI003CC8D2AF